MLTAVSAKPTAEETQTQAEDPLVVGDSEVPTYSSPGMPPFGMPPGGMPGMPSMPGGPAWGPNSDQFKMMQSRLAALKKKFDSLNETEREEIKEKAKAFRQKMEEDAKAMQEKMEEDLKNGSFLPHLLSCLLQCALPATATRKTTRTSLRMTKSCQNPKDSLLTSSLTVDLTFLSGLHGCDLPRSTNAPWDP